MVNQEKISSEEMFRKLLSGFLREDSKQILLVNLSSLGNKNILSFLVHLTNNLKHEIRLTSEQSGASKTIIFVV